MQEYFFGFVHAYIALSWRISAMPDAIPQCFFRGSEKRILEFIKITAF
jgi:hypothetical protein